MAQEIANDNEEKELKKQREQEENDRLAEEIERLELMSSVTP